MHPFSRRPQIFHGEYFTVDKSWQRQLEMIGIKVGNRWQTVVGDKLISHSPAARCFRQQLDDGSVIYFKRYVYERKFWLEFWGRPSKASVEVFAYQQLAKLGIPTLEPIAFAEYRRFGMLLATCIVTREMPDTVELKQFAVDRWYRMAEPQRSQIYKEIATKLVAQMRIAHAANFFHHDLKWRNILIQRKADNYTPVWIDAPRASFQRFRSKRGVMVDLSGLARIAVSVLNVNDRMRFICQYLGKDRQAGDAKRLYQQVEKHLSRRPPRPLVLPKR